MTTDNDLERFVKAQEKDYRRALAEIRNGRKTSHWMWYIFPQIAGLGHSSTARFYAIKDFDEAQSYLAHPVLRARLVEISEALLSIEDKTAREIFGSPDDLKLKSSMTLFSAADESESIFTKVLEKYFGGKPDVKTLEIIKRN